MSVIEAGKQKSITHTHTHPYIPHSGQPLFKDAAAPDLPQPSVPGIPHGATLPRDHTADAPRLAPGGPRSHLPPDTLFHGQTLIQRGHSRPHHEL